MGELKTALFIITKASVLKLTTLLKLRDSKESAECNISFK